MGIVATPDSSQIGSTQTKETPPPANLGVIVAPAEGEVIRVINSTPNPDIALKEIAGTEAVTTTDALTQIASIDTATQVLETSSPTTTELPRYDGAVGYTDVPFEEPQAREILSYYPGTTDRERVEAADRYPKVAEQLGWNTEDIDALRASLTGDDEKGDKFTRDFDHLDRVGTMYADLISEMTTNPTVSENALMKKVLEGIHSMERMTPEVGRAFAIVDRFVKFREIATTLKERYPDPAKLFEKVYGFVPEGRVSIIPGSIEIAFHVPNENDRAHAFSGTGDPDKQPRVARTASGFVGHHRTIDGLNVDTMVLKYDDTPMVLDHERQHTINNALVKFQTYFGKSYYIPDLEADVNAGKDPKQAIDRFIQDVKVRNLDGALDEVVAFYSYDKNTAESTIECLTRTYRPTEYVTRFRGLDPYFLEKMIGIVGEEHRQYIIEQGEKVLGAEYDRSVTDCVNAYDSLLKAGYTREQTFGLLLNVPPESWKRFASFKILKDKARNKG